MKSLYTADEVKNEVMLFVRKDSLLDFVGLEPGWQSKSYPGTFEWDKTRYPDPKNLWRRCSPGNPPQSMDQSICIEGCPIL